MYIHYTLKASILSIIYTHTYVFYVYVQKNRKTDFFSIFAAKDGKIKETLTVKT